MASSTSTPKPLRCLICDTWTQGWHVCARCEKRTGLAPGPRVFAGAR